MTTFRKLRAGITPRESFSPLRKPAVFSMNTVPVSRPPWPRPATTDLAKRFLVFEPSLREAIADWSVADEFDPPARRAAPSKQKKSCTCQCRRRSPVIQERQCRPAISSMPVRPAPHDHRVGGFPSSNVCLKRCGPKIPEPLLKSYSLMSWALNPVLRE